ncbi:MAG: hypothetical protein ACI4UA_01780 [Bacteroidaceae bacterium]
MRKRLLSLCLMAVMTVMSTSAWALDQKDGVYQIGSLEDYLAFAQLVNTDPDEGGNPAANAELIADIDLGSNGTMIGTLAPYYFRGTFDGKGHTIKADFYPTEDYCALFRRLQNTAEVRNLRTNVTITTASKYGAGIAAYAQGAHIHNCYVETKINSSVVGDATHAGVVAIADRAVFVENCFVKFNVQGVATTNCGGILGWLDNWASVQNCLVINETNMSSVGGCGTISRNEGNLKGVDLGKYANGERPEGASYTNFATSLWDNDKFAVIVNGATLSDGSVCYRLNHDQSKITWTQDLEKDPYPLPAPFGSGKQVYASAETDCHGNVAEETEIAYSNTASSVTCEKHEYDVYGVCPKCGHYDLASCPRNDKTHKIEITSQDDFMKAEGFNRVSRGTFYDMLLMNDVTLTMNGAHIFNNDNWYGGTFEGQNHAITINFTNAPEAASLFPQLQGTVKNLIMHGTISGAAKYYGSVSGHTQGGSTVIENVYSDIMISSTYGGDATLGGIVGVVENNVTFNNVIYAGTISGADGTVNVGGFCGWSSGRSYINNCAFIGDFSNVGGETYTFSRRPDTVTPVNSYYVNGKDINPGSLKAEAADVASGRLAYLLNGSEQGGTRFYQNLSGEVDPTPMPIAEGHAKVYAYAPSFSCDGTPLGTITYTNDGGDINIPDHSYDHGFCTECGNIDEHYLTPDENNWFSISTGNDLSWWSNYAAKVDLGCSARLTADITMSDQDNERYMNIGTENKPFYGNFDGQFHRISNLRINIDQIGVGLISVMNSEPKKPGSDDEARAKDPIFVRDVIIDNTSSITGRGYVGIIGMTAPWGGNILVQNVGMEGDVTAISSANAGGVLGCVMSSSCKITIDNSFMSGNVYGVNENGSFSGWLGSYATVSNCYASGTVEHPQSDDDNSDRYFARYSTATITNCFARYGGELSQDGKVVVAKVSDEDVVSGALAFRANGNTSVNPKWYQNINDQSDEHPVPVPTHGVVFKLLNGYMSVANEGELQELTERVLSEATDYADVTMAEKALLEKYTSSAEALGSLETVEEVAKAYETVLKDRDAAVASAGQYENFVKEMTKVQEYLQGHMDFEGEERDILEAYFESTDEPGDVYPMGGYLYIIEEMQATGAELDAEITRVNEALQEAVRNGYVPGTEVTNLMTNADFLLGTEGWNNPSGVAVKICDFEGKKIAGAERWDGEVPGMYQTVEGMKPGYYKVEITGAVRPANDRYGLNYNATFDVNGTANYFMADIEEPINVNDTIDGVNCNLHGGTNDLAIYEDGYSTDAETGGDPIGYVMQGQLSVACVINADVRYKNYTLAQVGEDGKLTFTIRQDKSIKNSDWLGFGNIRLTYCGDAESEVTTEALDDVMSSYVNRATTILDKYVPEFEAYGKAPSFPAALRTALDGALAEAGNATTNEEKIALVQRFSDIFKEILDAKKAYAYMMYMAEVAVDAAGKLGTDVGQGEYDKIVDAMVAVSNGYMEGTYSREEAENLDMMLADPVIAPYIPAKEDGVLQIGNIKQMAYYSSYLAMVDKYAKADLVADIKGFTTPMMIQDFNGVLDGKFHSIEVDIVKEDGTDNAAIFHNIDGTVKNLIVLGNITTNGKYAAGVAAHGWASARIERVTSSVHISSSLVGDGTHAGILGVAENAGGVITDCVFNGIMEGSETSNCGGFIGWCSATVTIQNSLQIANITVGTNDSYTWARNPDNLTLTNSYYLTPFATPSGTQTSEEKMKSGELCYLLNGKQSDEPVWFQTLGTEAVPHVTPGATVYYYGGEYINEKPQIELNAYASSVNVSSDAEKVVVTYQLNAPAKEGEIRFYNGTDIVYTETLTSGNLTTGVHQVTVANTSLPAAGTTLTFDVKVTGFGSKDPARVGETYKVYRPYGMAVMNDTESRAFGTIYMVESEADATAYGEGTSSTGFVSDTKRSALYAFTPTFEQILAADGTPGFKGGIEDGQRVVVSNSYPNADYKNVRCSQDGRLFVSRISGMTASPIYEVNPIDLNEAWSPIFTGGTKDETTGITYVGEEEQARPNVSFDIAGKGENLQLLTLGMARSDGGFNYTDYKANIYALGTAKEWAQAANYTFEPLTGQYTIAPMPVNVLSDQRGGAWYIQYRSKPSAIQPAIKHYNAEGVEDYSDISTNLEFGGCAISADGTRLALARGGQIAVYETDYQPLPNGLINVNPVLSFNHKESQVSAMAFDYAGNLMVAARGSQAIARYVIPRADNVVVTPARKECTFKVGETMTGVEQIETETGDQKIFNLQGIQLNRAQKGVNIINGRKVMVK